ncbi:MAG: D-arabinono-1,4-lactone oxidase [Euzebya sp.]
MFEQTVVQAYRYALDPTRLHRSASWRRSLVRPVWPTTGCSPTSKPTWSWGNGNASCSAAGSNPPRAGGRPHWGKVHTLTADRLRGLYPGWEQFQAVRAAYDPDGVFTSPYLRQILG